jgi:cysteine dioxygenase
LNTPALDQLSQGLEREFDRDPRGRGVAALLSTYARSQEDWEQLAVFDPVRYTRNLIHRCSAFELLLLCWEVDQESPVHDHSGQDCWMAVLRGELEEQHYIPPRALSVGPMALGKRSEVGRGGVAYIADGIALHRIRPLHGARGMSLHLYSRPIDTCRVYDPRTGASTLVELGYHSVRGKPCHQPAKDIRAAWATRQG